jgi:hypothetical protein
MTNSSILLTSCYINSSHLVHILYTVLRVHPFFTASLLFYHTFFIAVLHYLSLLLLYLSTQSLLILHSLFILLQYFFNTSNLLL